MSLNVALALIVGCVCGVFSTITLIGLALAVKEHNNKKNQIEQEDTTEHE